MKAIQTKFLPATNSCGSRIKAIAGWKKSLTITIPYPDESSGMDAHAQAALALCRKMGLTGKLIGGGLPDSYVFVFAPWEEQEYGQYEINKGVRI